MSWQFAPDHHVPPVQTNSGGLCLHPPRLQMVQLWSKFWYLINNIIILI